MVELRLKAGPVEIGRRMELAFGIGPGALGWRVEQGNGWTCCPDCWHRSAEAAVRHWQELTAPVAVRRSA